MKDLDRERMQELLRQAVPPMERDAEPDRELWPRMLRRMEPGAVRDPLAWFDWALAGGIAVAVAAFPASIPVLLYYL